jgi:3-oxoacyl-[acyl-carrier protein] reductase
MTLELNGRTAIVTGAGSATGIGFAVARRLLAEGTDVAVTATGERIHARAKELATKGPRVIPYQADLTNESEVQELVRVVHGRFGRIDILVNNAGMARKGQQPANRELSATSLEEWQEQIAITLNTAFLMTRAVLPIMRAQRFGRIVNVTSVTGPLVSGRNSGAYGAAKGGMDGMMRAVAIAEGPNGITMNGVAPGWIRTGSSLPEEMEAANTHRSGAPERQKRLPQPSAFLRHPKRPTLPDRFWLSTAGTSCRKSRRLKDKSNQMPGSSHAEASRRPLLRPFEGAHLTAERERVKKWRPETSNKVAHLRLGKANEILVRHAHGVTVRSRVENNLFVFGERFIDIHGQVVKGTERRHGAEFTVRKELAKFELRGQTNRLSEHLREFVEVHVFGSRQNRENRFRSLFPSAEHNGLCHFATGDLHDGRCALCGVGSGVR